MVSPSGPDSSAKGGRAGTGSALLLRGGAEGRGGGRAREREREREGERPTATLRLPKWEKLHHAEAKSMNKIRWSK